MTKRVTTEGVTAKQNRIDGKNNCPVTDPKTDLPRRVREPHSLPRIVQEDHDEREREIKKIPVHVLKNQRKRTLAEITLAGLAYRARRRVRPERFVISASVVVTRQPKAAGRPKDNQCGRPRKPRRKPRGLRAEPTVQRIAEQ